MWGQEYRRGQGCRREQEGYRREQEHRKTQVMQTLWLELES